MRKLFPFVSWVPRVRAVVRIAHPVSCLFGTMEASLHSLQDVLSIGKAHPFYNENVEYPLDRATLLDHVTKRAAGLQDLANWPLLHKKHLYVRFSAAKYERID